MEACDRILIYSRITEINQAIRSTGGCLLNLDRRFTFLYQTETIMSVKNSTQKLITLQKVTLRIRDKFAGHQLGYTYLSELGRAGPQWRREIIPGRGHSGKYPCGQRANCATSAPGLARFNQFCFLMRAKNRRRFLFH